jgi:photosystem II stability/assembly factor-like uncharacterized protein
MVDWSEDEPTLVVAQNRIRPNLKVSTDGGQKFQNVPGRIVGIVEPTWNHEYMRKQNGRSWERFKQQHVLGYGVSDGAVLLGRWDVGIERSTDGGKTFEPVSELIVSAHTPVRFNGKLYWGAEDGVIVSDNGGWTWSLLGTGLPMVRKGPFFGADAANMVVVTEEGVYRTRDAGQTWQKVSELVKVEDAWRADVKPLWLRTDYAWDHTRNILYVAGMAGCAYKRHLPE